MKSIAEKMNDAAFLATLPRSRKEAKEKGIAYYYTEPCKHGHNSYRRTVNGACSMCVTIYTKKHQATIPDGTLEEYKLKKDKNWNNGDKGREAKQRWKEKNPKWAWVVNSVGRSRIRARQNGIPFNLTNEYVYNMTPDVCPVLGVTFSFLGNKKVLPSSPSIDRLKPSLGYTEGNITIISQRANVIKSDANLEEIEKVYMWLKAMDKP